MENNEPNWRRAIWRGLIAGLVLSGAGSRPPGPAEQEIVNTMLKQWPSRLEARHGASAVPCCAAPLGRCCAMA